MEENSKIQKERDELFFSLCDLQEDIKQKKDKIYELDIFLKNENEMLKRPLQFKEKLEQENKDLQKINKEIFQKNIKNRKEIEEQQNFINKIKLDERFIKLLKEEAIIFEPIKGKYIIND